jgi:hypothetical protein
MSKGGVVCASRKAAYPRAVRPVARSSWATFVVLLSIFSLVWLLASAATHHHKTALAEHDCVVCSAASVSIAVDNPPVVVAAPVDFLVYFFTPVHVSDTFVATVLNLPPSRGPPVTSA